MLQPFFEFSRNPKATDENVARFWSGVPIHWTMLEKLYKMQMIGFIQANLGSDISDPVIEFLRARTDSDDSAETFYLELYSGMRKQLRPTLERLWPIITQVQKLFNGAPDHQTLADLGKTLQEFMGSEIYMVHYFSGKQKVFENDEALSPIPAERLGASVGPVSQLIIQYPLTAEIPRNSRQEPWKEQANWPLLKFNPGDFARLDLSKPGEGAFRETYVLKPRSEPAHRAPTTKKEINSP